ncbi:hypothetical protein LSCM1_07580 [Leishmania martiniquensis]|uniref:DNA 3'-5' helicase n=1 Tax=Leishmania martiniquensis TaxID=1580590 RepID=A0A836KWK0_9TRYP|nr:hypothetical protein LSCM1_07580 [Leishmania martiniquensis]
MPSSPSVSAPAICFGGSTPPISHSPRATVALPRQRVGYAPRTSFTYTSRPLSPCESKSSETATPSLSLVAPHSSNAVSAAGGPVAASLTVSASVPNASVTQEGGVAQRSPTRLHEKDDALSRLPSAVLSRMDEWQIRAATFPVDAALILQAGAGSGKTQTMAARIAFLLQSGVPGASILGICFTRQAAEALRDRVRSTLPPTLARQAHMLKLKTFHAFGLECLRRFGGIGPDTHVLDARQQRQLARRVVETYAQRDKSSEAVTDLVDYVNRVKTMKTPPIPQSDPGLQDAYLFPYYQEALHEEHHAVDFGDLQHMFYELLRPVPATTLAASQGSSGRLPEREPCEDGHEPQQQQQHQQGRLFPPYVCTALRAEFTHFVVDEFQDFNEIQVELLALLAGNACRVTCVGDPNQCIYTWRGAMPNVFGVWKKRFPQTAVLTLETNYRSDGPIVAAANSVVKANQLAYHHREEHAVTLVQCANEDDELQAVPLVIEHMLRRRDPRLGYEDIAILCRSRRRVQLYCDVLQSHRIPVRQLRGMSLDHLSSMRSLLAYLRLCTSPHSPEGDADVRTVLNTAPLHRLSGAAAKKFLLSLESVCQARRAREAARIRSWHHPIHADGCSEAGADDKGAQGTRREGSRPGAACASATRGAITAAPTPGAHPETHSFFAVLQELVYHNFSRELFPKLEVSKKSQKCIRSVTRIVVHVNELLAHPSCDVEQVLRYVLREGGYESDSTATFAARTKTTSAATRGTKRARDSAGDLGSGRSADEASGRSSASAHQPRAGVLLMDRCASQHNQQQQRYISSASSSSSSACGSSSTWDRRHHASRRGGSGCGGDGALDEDVLPPEEEAAVWQEQRMNLSELVLHTYRSVREAMQREVAHELGREGGGGAGRAEEAGLLCHPSSGSGYHSNSRPRPLLKAAAADDSINDFGVGNTTATKTVMETFCQPAVVLHRVLDEFVSLVSSDDYGPMQEAANADGLATAAAGVDTAGGSRHPPATTSSHWIGKLTVSTVHRAKGMEWPAVLLPGCWVGEYPVRPREEEKRVFYVGMSRAIKHLVCFTAATREVGVGSGQAATTACMADLAQHAQSGRLEPTPYLAAVGNKLERVTYADLKSAYLKDQGYL